MENQKCKILDESILFISRVSLKIFSRSSLHFVGIREFIVGYEKKCEKSLTTGMSCKFQSLENKMARMYFLSCSDLVGLTLHLPACFTCLLHFGKSPLGSQSRVKSRVTFLLHTLDQIFTLFLTQPLHYSHLNTRFLNAELQTNLVRNKANT